MWIVEYSEMMLVQGRHERERVAPRLSGLAVLFPN